jgi:hypothetical protein
MSQTRAELDQKLVALQERMSELSPHNLKQRYMSEYFVDRVIGGILTVIGLKMAWSQYRWHHDRRARVRGRLAEYHSW